MSTPLTLSIFMSLAEIPITPKYLQDEHYPPGEENIFDVFPPEQQAKSIREAELRLEADVNGGQAIADPTDLHSQAVSYFAGYRLARSPQHPASQFQGDWSDDIGGEISYADSLKSDYLDLIQRIEATDDDDLDGDGTVDTGHDITATVI
jgi:hypothetical protein